MIRGQRARGGVEREMGVRREDHPTHQGYLDSSPRHLRCDTLITPTSRSLELFARHFHGRIPGLQVDWKEIVPNVGGVGTLVRKSRERYHSFDGSHRSFRVTLITVYLLALFVRL